MDNLVVIVETPGMTEPKISAWLDSFRSYDSSRWEFVELDALRIYVPRGQTVDKGWLASTVAEPN